MKFSVAVLLLALSLIISVGPVRAEGSENPNNPNPTISWMEHSFFYQGSQLWAVTAFHWSDGGVTYGEPFMWETT